MKKHVVIFDYGFGNLRSASRAFEHVGAKVSLTSDFDEAVKCDGLIVPGVGAFDACIAALKTVRGGEIIKKRVQNNAPVFGICVGHQILFDSSTEGSRANGLGLIAGKVDKLESEILPHMGWNTVEVDSQLVPEFSGVESERFYFVHSYAAPVPSGQDTQSGGTKSSVNIAYTQHENVRFVSAVKSGSLFGTQFHPEKSGHNGLHLIKNWVDAL